MLSALIETPYGREDDLDTRHQRSELPVFKRLLANVEFAPIITAGTGRPVNPLTGLDTNRSQAFPLASRPLDFGRNSLQTPPTVVFDLRLLKSFYFPPHEKLDLVVESFNLLNHTNVSGINPFFGAGLAANPGFDEPIDALNARQIEFSLDLEY